MIAHIQGRVDYKGSNYVVVEAGGVGYKIFTSTYTQSVLPNPGEKIKLRTCLQVSKDANTLYGFSSPEEQDLFEMLIGISRIGAKSALSLLSLPPLELTRAIIREDLERIRVPGVGRKTAQRIILELKEKIKSKYPLSEAEPTKATPEEEAPYLEAVTGLVSLGYSRMEAKEAVDQIKSLTNKGLKVEEIIKESLKLLGG